MTTPADGRIDVAPEPVPGARAAVSNWNVANLLTMLRVVLVPLFVLVLMHDGGHDTGWRIAAAGVFFAASATDRLDGELARRRHLITDFGKIADPIADKALTGSALIGLSALGQLPWWVTIVIAVREVGVTLLRFWVIRYGVIAASWGGKAKTLFQIIAIGLFVLPLPAALGVVGALRWVVMGIAVALTMITGVDYVFRAVRLRVSSSRTSSTPAADTQTDDRAA